jgi:DNA-binding LacI/PurR family transcriptional regulator
MALGVRSIARECKCSPATVSNAINNKGRINAQTRKKVLAVIRRLNYNPHGNIPWFKKVKTRLIGLVTPTTSAEIDPFFSRAIACTREMTGRHGYNCVLYFDQEIAHKAVEEFHQGRGSIPCDGLIFFCPYHPWDQSLEALKSWGVPTVLVRRETTVAGIPTITDNDRKGSRLAMQHLHQLGHTRIGFVGTWAETVPDERFRAYRDYLRQHGLENSTAWVCNKQTAARPELRAWLQELWAAPVRPTAFACTSDECAAGLINTLRGLGLRVPADVSVTGYDNNRTAAEFHPALTTVNVPVREMIERAGQLLFETLGRTHQDHAPAERINIEIENELVVRESTGPAAT